MSPAPRLHRDYDLLTQAKCRGEFGHFANRSPRGIAGVENQSEPTLKLSSCSLTEAHRAVFFVRFGTPARCVLNEHPGHKLNETDLVLCVVAGSNQHWDGSCNDTLSVDSRWQLLSKNVVR